MAASSVTNNGGQCDLIAGDTALPSMRSARAVRSLSAWTNALPAQGQRQQLRRATQRSRDQSSGVSDRFRNYLGGERYVPLKSRQSVPMHDKVCQRNAEVFTISPRGDDSRPLGARPSFFVLMGRLLRDGVGAVEPVHPARLVQPGAQALGASLSGTVQVVSGGEGHPPGRGDEVRGAQPAD